MEKFDKILELLEKKSLTEAEKKSLEEFSDSDDEIKSFISFYDSLRSSLTVTGHIPTDLLASYVMFEMGDASEDNIIPVLREKIKSHLDQCKVCKNEFTVLQQEYSEIKVHVDKSVLRTSQSSLKEKNFFVPSFLKSSSSVRYAFATLALFIAAYIGLFVVSNSITPDYRKNIFSDEQNDFYKTRGRTSPLFQKGLNAIDKGDYSKAIEFLSEDITKHQNEKSIFYTNYILGITYIRSAESDFIGLFKSYDRNQVELAIANLKESIDKNNSGDYESLKLDANYYIGRAYLLTDDKNLALESLQKVVDGRGRYSKEASKLISDLERN